MIPKYLSIEGLYSYREPQEIDFTRLTEAHLFGIFGATGSGKSSILEAISFALYGECDRLNAREKRGYNMMNLRSNRLAIRFDFDLEGVGYRFEVLGKRHSKRFDEVGTFERRAFREENGNWIPLETANAEPILGLSYPNFRRTVIIPQGQFQEFLELTETDRTRMLKELFGLEKFELASKVGVLDQQNQRALDQAEALVQQYTEVNPEAMENSRTNLEALRQSLVTLRQQLHTRQQAVQQADEARKKGEILALAEAEHRALSARSSDVSAREQQLKAYETCLRDFQPLLEKRHDLLRRIHTLDSEKKDSQAVALQSEKHLEEKRAVFKTVEANYLQRDRLQQLAQELDQAIALLKIEEEIRISEDRIENGKQLILQKEQAIAERTDEIRLMVEKRSQLRSQLPDTRMLMAVREWFAKRRELEKGKQEVENRMAQDQSELDEYVLLRTKKLREAGLSPDQTQLAPATLTQAFGLLITQAEATYEAAALAADKERVRQHLTSIADSLQPGEPCPLCGSVHHPEPAKNTAATNEQEEALSMAKAQLQRLQTTAAQLSEWLAREDRMTQRLAEAQNQRLVAEKALRQHVASFEFAGLSPDSEEEVNLRLQSVSDMQASIESLEQLERSQRDHLALEEEDLGKYQRGLQKIQQDISGKKGEWNAGTKALRLVDLDEQRSRSREMLENEALENRRQHEQIEKLYQRYTLEIKELESGLNRVRGELAQLDKQLKDQTQEFERLRKQTEAAIAASSFESLKSVEDILALPIQIDRERKELQEFRVALQTAEKQLIEAQKAALANPFDAAGYDALVLSVAETARELQQKEQELGAAEETLRRLETAWKARQSLEKEIKALKKRGEDLRTLRNLFKASGFVNFVSAIYLDQLCKAANERFHRLTRHTLELIMGPNNSLLVRDWLNGGKERNVKTLSGGQTFQAALSLALALADQVQQQSRARQNFFFLDEGFGSQDKQSLMVVMETLKSLRRENRVVGVISHVEEMQEALGAFVQVTLDPEKGSMVRNSWE